jgi:hypothetical protein
MTKTCDVSWCVSEIGPHSSIYCSVHRQFPVLNRSDRFEAWTARIRQERATRKRLATKAAREAEQHDKSAGRAR